MSGPSILVEGVGGIGGIVAGRLLRAGHDVTMVTGNADIAEAIERDGLKVTAPGGSFTVEGTAVPNLEDLPEGRLYDVALLLMKAHPVVEVSRKTLAYLDPDAGYLVTCQNGIVEDSVVAEVGEERVVSGIVGWGGTMHAPGVYEKTGPGGIHIGELDGRVSARVKALAGILGDVTDVVVTDNIRGALWSKLAINCIITSMGALSGQTLGTMLAQRKCRDIGLGLYREVVDTAHAHGVKLVEIAADPLLLYVPADAGALTRFFKDRLAWYVGRKHGRLRSSMLQSLERGRLSEVDYLNGHVVTRAAQKGLSVPCNEKLVSMIKEIEAGDRKIQPSNLDELARV